MVPTAALSSLIEQTIYTVPSFELECGHVLKQVPVAYKTWGKLNEKRDNAMIICHAFTGSADVEDWWGPLMGRGKAFDPSRYFIFCANVLGSPYGTASPITINPETGELYGPEFPGTTIRDDVRLHKHVLDHLGVKSVAVVVGGSMGGMAVLEWPLCTPPGYIRHVVPIATSARHSAWCISWGEAQRQSIYSDPIYEDGYYSSQPASGLAAARMAALLTYRSRDSFESRFGRNAQVNRTMGASASAELITPPRSPVLSPDDARQAHNDGLRNSKPRPSSRAAGSISEGSTSSPPRTPASPPPIFSAQGYLRYQGDKFTARFDANCYIHITRKMDTHDLARGRVLPTDSIGTTTTTTPLPSSVAKSESHALAKVLARLPPRALVIGIQTDGLFTTTEQIEIASGIPDAELIIIPSPDGHDGFLLEFERINRHLMEFLRREFKEYYVGEHGEELEVVPEEGFDVKKTSMFGEAEADIAAW